MSAYVSAAIEKAKEYTGEIFKLDAIGKENEIKARILEGREIITKAIATPGADRIIDSLASIYASLSANVLTNYATLDVDHVASLRKAVNRIKTYINDTSLTKPLNFLLLASPGSGKSHLIDSITQFIAAEHAVRQVPFNMATMRSKDDLGRVLDDARDAKVDGKTPVIFLDEFDADPANYSLLLPLLWDGKLDIGRRELRLGRSIFFLAGSRKTLPKMLDDARNLAAKREDQPDDKTVDLFSRTNGTVIQLPSLAGKNRGPDRLIVSIALLRRRFKKLESVSWALLWFIAEADFRYEARSIGTLIDQIDVPIGKNADSLTELTLNDLAQLPFADIGQLAESPIAFHLVHPQKESGIKSIWDRAVAHDTQLALGGNDQAEIAARMLLLSV